VEPVGHTEHDVEFSNALKLPTPHGVQLASPAAAKEPAAHAVHEALLLTALTKPPLHCAQTRSAVVEFGVETKDPGAQSETGKGHPVSGRLPMVLSRSVAAGWYVPGAHGLQTRSAVAVASADR